MTPSSLLKRSPFRLAAAFTALFVATALLIFGFLYVRIGSELESLIRHRVEETAGALAAIGREKGLAELGDLVASEISSVRYDDAILLLVDKEGRFRGGNVRGVGTTDGWFTLERSTLTFVSDRGKPDDSFIARWTPVEGGALLVGLSDSEIRTTRELLLNGLAWGLLATLLLSPICAAVLARSAQTRIDAIASTLEAVSQGQLDARVPMMGTDDDFDHIGEQINRTLSKLKVLVDSVNQASSDIAHDLKKPISRIQQGLEEARRKAARPEEFRDAIDDALSQLEATVETFEALLNITQIEAGARKSRFATVDLRDVIADVEDVYAAVAEDSGDRLVVSPRLLNAAIIRGDRELLVQLLANLVENAIRHCPSGTTIGLELTETKGGYLICVTDDGPGIPADERTKVLRRLYRLERARSTPGSGLGLSLASAIAELHDARLTLEGNDPGLRASLAVPASAA